MSAVKTKAIGNLGEDLAAGYLLENHFQILARNLRLPMGEIDILARDKKVLVIVEVKTKTGDQFGHPADMVGRQKSKKLCQLARFLLAKHPNQQIRIDVAAVDLRDNPSTIDYLADVIDCVAR